MKKKATKSIRKDAAFITKKTFILTLSSTIILTTIVTLVGLLVVYTNLVSKEDESSVSKIAYMVNNAVDGLTEETPTASYSDMQFINEAKVKFTKSGYIKLRHFYSPAYEGSDEYIVLSDVSLLKQASSNVVSPPTIKEQLKKVPSLQFCARLFAVSFSNKKPDYSAYDLLSTKRLDDGRTAHLWKLAGDTCENYQEIVNNLQVVVESIESY